MFFQNIANSLPRCTVYIHFVWNLTGVLDHFKKIKYSEINAAWLLSLGHKKSFCFSMALSSLGHSPWEISSQIMRKFRPHWGTTCLCSSYGLGQQPELTVRLVNEVIFREFQFPDLEGLQLWLSEFTDKLLSLEPCTNCHFINTVILLLFYTTKLCSGLSCNSREPCHISNRYC